MLIGVISDTHGYLDPRVAGVFTGVELILHAGDVGSLLVLGSLAEIAPVVAVRGNNDDKLGGLGLESHQSIEVAGRLVHLVHQLSQALPPEGTDVVVFGHSHRPLSERRGCRLYLNPGAAGVFGFHRRQSVALLEMDAGEVAGRIVDLGEREPRLGSSRGMKGLPLAPP